MNRRSSYLTVTIKQCEITKIFHVTPDETLYNVTQLYTKIAKSADGSMGELGRS
jgi:hypothetical protein